MTERLSNTAHKITGRASTTGKSSNVEYRPLKNGMVRFKVRAPNDAHIALSTEPSMDAKPLYEIILDGFDHSSKEQRKYKNCIQKKSDLSNAMIEDSSGLLSADEFRGFWIKWENKIITVGKEVSIDPFMTWTEKEAFPIITHVGVCTHSGATGIWKVEGSLFCADGWEFKTPDKYKYSFVTLNSGFVEFEFKGEKECWVRLTTAAEKTEVSYTFILGGWENSKSAIRYGIDASTYMVEVPSPNVLSPKEFRKFVIKWHCGRYQALNGMELIMEWTSPILEPVVTHYKLWTRTGLVHEFKNDKSGIGWIENTPEEPTENEVLSTCRYMWVDAANGAVSGNAISAGLSAAKNPVYVARAKIEKTWCIGSLEPPEKFALFNWNHKKWTISQYQVLVAGEEWSKRKDLWSQTSAKKTIKGALVAGLTDKNEELYVGRVHLKRGGVLIGWVSRTADNCHYVDLEKPVESDIYDIMLG